MLVGAWGFWDRVWPARRSSWQFLPTCSGQPVACVKILPKRRRLRAAFLGLALTGEREAGRGEHQIRCIARIGAGSQALCKQVCKARDRNRRELGGDGEEERFGRALAGGQDYRVSHVGKTKAPQCRPPSPNALLTWTAFRCSKGRSANHLPRCDKHPAKPQPHGRMAHCTQAWDHHGTPLGANLCCSDGPWNNVVLLAQLRRGR